MEKITCLWCWYISIEWPRWSYDICDICGWEDDLYGNNNPYIIWWANNLSLKNSQEIFLYNEKKWKINTYSFIKDLNWKPLSKINIKKEETQKSYFDFITEEEPNNNYLWI